MIKKMIIFLGIYFTLLPVYAGEKMSLDLSNAPLKECIKTLAEFNRMSLILSPHIKGLATLKILNATPEDILNSLLETQGLAKRRLGNIWYVAPQVEMIHLHEEALHLHEAIEASAEIKTQVWQMHYAKADEIAHLLLEGTSSLLSRRGQLRVDLRTNSICIQDTVNHLRDIYKVIQQVDVPVQQVLIEARLASVDSDWERELGLRFEEHQYCDQGESNIAHSDCAPQANLPCYSLAIARLVDNAFLDIKLDALESEGHGELISSPSLFTSNRQTAYIESGEDIPYQESTSSGATNVTFKKAVLSLKVTPQVMPNQMVWLELQINQDKPSNRMVLGVPAITTHQMSTHALLHNGQTIVLGGIYETNDENGIRRIPFLSKIPMIGVLFRDKHCQCNKRELLIFVTPKIIS